MHYALSESARDVKERKARSTPSQSHLGLPKLNPFERTPRRRRRTSYKIYPQGLSAVARTTVTGRTLFIQLVRVVTELTDLRARYSRTRSRDES